MMKFFSMSDPFEELFKVYVSQGTTHNLNRENVSEIVGNDGTSACVFEFVVPGFKQNEIEIIRDGKTLVVKGKNKVRNFEKFYEIRTSEKYDWSCAKAKLEDGILSLTIPIKESEKTQKILIE